ncbi:hypothetical protein BVX95_01775 [archaeon D22]|nr:hypothetical protein BVX95_01775 [archaeon D22]
MTNIYESNIWKFYLYRIVSTMDLTVSTFILFLLSNNLTITQVMTLQTIFVALILLLEIPSGAFADIYGKKLSISLGIFCATISYLIFAVGTNYLTFLIAMIFMAFCWALTSGADSALLFDSLKEAKKEKKYAKIFGKGNFLVLLNWAFLALIGSYLSIHIGYRNLFLISAFLFFIGSIIAISFKEPPIHKKVNENNYFRHIAEAVKFSKDHKVVKNLIIYFGIFAALGHITWILIQPFYEQSTLPSYLIGIATFLYFISAGARKSAC